MSVVRTALKWLTTPLDRKKLLRFCLLFGMALGLLAHAFMFTNKLPNHDDLEFYMDLSYAGLGAGRYFLHFFWKCFSDLSTPWLNGVMGVFFMNFGTFFLCDTFDWRQNWQAVAAAVIMQLFPANIDIYCYMYEAHVLMLGIACACFAPWLVRHGGKLRWLWTALAVWVATGIYQINVMLAIGLLILYVVYVTVEGLKEGRSAAKSWGFAVYCAAAAVAGLMLYLVGLKALGTVVTLNEYQGVNQTGSLTLSLIPGKIVESYRTVWNEYVADVPDYVNSRMMLFRLPMFLLGVAGLGWGAVKCFAKKAPLQGLLIVVCMALLPLACCGIYFMGDDITKIHIITLYPLILMLLALLTVVWPAVPEDTVIRRGLALATAVLYLGYGVNGVVLANQVYLRHHQSFTRAEHFANRLAARIEEVEGYHPGVPLATWGYMNHEDSLLYFEYDVASRYLPFGGIRMEMDYMWPYCAANMLNVVVGLPVSDGQGWAPETPEEQAQLDAMPYYPAEGSVAMIGDTCVVKFSW